MVRLILFSFALVGLLGLALAADDRPSDAAIKEAIALLEAKKAQADKKEDQDRIDKAIDDLEKLLPAGKAGEKAVPPKFNATALAKKFSGKAAFNPKTGELSIVYDFKSKDQLKDFEAKDSKPVVKNGAVHLTAGDSIAHAAKFESVTISGTVGLGSLNKQVILISTSAPASLRAWEFNGLNVGVFAKGDLVAEKYFNRVGLGAVPFRFSVGPKKMLAKILNTTDFGGNVNFETAGSVGFHGGTGGAAYSNLVISGVPDKEWLEGLK